MKKTIKDLEGKKRIETEGLVQLEGHLGETLLERLHRDGESTHWENFTEYRRVISEIASAEADITQIDADVQRLKEVEEAISGNERLLTEQTKKLAEQHTLLGEEILDEPELIAYSQSYKTELEAILVKVQELESKLGGLADKEGEKSGFFSRIGKNVQGITLRSSLGKNQEQIRKLCEATGEKFTLAPNPSGNEKLNALAAEVEDLRAQNASLADELVALKEERAKINEKFNIEGNPIKHVKALEKTIAQLNATLHPLYAKAGKEAADASLAGTFEILGIRLNEEETAFIDKIALTREKVSELETRIASLKAAIAIDEEKEGIVHHRKAIEDQRRRISDAELAIAALETRINDSEQRIVELGKFL